MLLWDKLLLIAILLVQPFSKTVEKGNNFPTLEQLTANFIINPVNTVNLQAPMTNENREYLIDTLNKQPHSMMPNQKSTWIPFFAQYLLSTEDSGIYQGYFERVQAFSEKLFGEPTYRYPHMPHNTIDNKTNQFVITLRAATINGSLLKPFIRRINQQLIKLLIKLNSLEQTHAVLEIITALSYYVNFTDQLASKIN